MRKNYEEPKVKVTCFEMQEPIAAAEDSIPVSMPGWGDPEIGDW